MTAPAMEQRLEWPLTPRQRVWVELTGACMQRDGLASYASLLSSRGDPSAHMVGLLSAQHQVRVAVLSAALRGLGGAT